MEEATAGKLAIRPRRGQVLVRQREYKDRLESGLFIPQGKREGYEDVGTVQAVGAGVVDVKVGDTVMFKRRAGTAVVPDVREGDPNGWKGLLVLKVDGDDADGDLLAVIEE